MKSNGNRINVEIIERYLKENKLSKSSFCKKCKISYCVFSKVLDGKSNFRLSAIFKIAWGMGIEGYDLFYKL